MQQQIKEKIEQLAQAICLAYQVSAQVAFNSNEVGYPVTINAPEEAAIVKEVAESLVSKEHVFEPVPSMGAEDFSFMLLQKPGCYAWIGNGSTAGGCLLHNPNYDFNDDNLCLGAAYWVKLVENVLA